MPPLRFNALGVISSQKRKLFQFTGNWGNMVCKKIQGEKQGTMVARKFRGVNRYDHVISALKNVLESSTGSLPN